MVRIESNNRYQNLFKEIMSIKPKTILEVGTHTGKQAERMVNSAIGFNREITYLGFDLFDDMTPDVKQKEIHHKADVGINGATQVLDALKRKHKGFNYKLYKGNTLETLPLFVDEYKGKVDFVFIDGGHSLDTIANDWRNIKKVMHEKTVVLFDDYYVGDSTKGCMREILRINKESDYKATLFPETDSHGEFQIKIAKVVRT